MNFNDVKLDSDGNIYAFGMTISQSFDAVLVKFDPNGILFCRKSLLGGEKVFFWLLLSHFKAVH